MSRTTRFFIIFFELSAFAFEGISTVMAAPGLLLAAACEGIAEAIENS